MARTETTVMNDIIRLLGAAHRFDAQWELPVDREGWHAVVMVGIHRWPGKNEVSISVHAHAHLDAAPDKGSWFHTLLMGAIHPRCITREWIRTVLTERIETARLAVLAVTEGDLRVRDGIFEGMTKQQIWQHLKDMRGYFLSTFGLPETSRVTG